MAKQASPEPTAPVNDPAAADAAAKVGKGAPTPSRKEQEAARKRPLVPGDRKEAAKASRQKTAEARERARVGMAAGEEKYLPIRDRGPQKRYVRDYVDARFSIGEVILPVMFLVILVSFVPDPAVQTYSLLGIWVFFAIAVVDCVILGFTLNRKLAAKFGKDKVEKVRWYASMRALQLRVIRLPKPQVKRGQYPS